MFDLKPDYDLTRRRIEAFWEFDVLDRPLAMFFLTKPFSEQVALPASHHVTPLQKGIVRLAKSQKI